MKLQTLLSSAALLLTAVPALAEEPVRAVAQPIEAFEDVIVSAGLYDSEDDEEDSYDMEDVAKKDSKKSDKKKKSKKSGRKNRNRRNRRSNRNNRRRRRKGMCRNPKGRSDRDLCDELEDRFCSGSGNRRNKQNRQLCSDLGFRRSVTDEEWALIDTEEFLPEEYDMLIDDVAEDIDDSSMDSEDEDESYDMDSGDSYDSYDDEDDSGDEEDSGDIELKEKGKGGGKKKGGSKEKTSKKKDSKKKKSNKKSKKSNKRSNRSSRSSSSSSRSCFDRSSRTSCEDTSRCEWFKTNSGGFCIEASSSSSDYDFAEE